MVYVTLETRHDQSPWIHMIFFDLFVRMSVHFKLLFEAHVRILTDGRTVYQQYCSLSGCTAPLYQQKSRESMAMITAMTLKAVVAVEKKNCYNCAPALALRICPNPKTTKAGGNEDTEGKDVFPLMTHQLPCLCFVCRGKLTNALCPTCKLWWRIGTSCLWQPVRSNSQCQALDNQEHLQFFQQVLAPDDIHAMTMKVHMKQRGFQNTENTEVCLKRIYNLGTASRRTQQQLLLVMNCKAVMIWMKNKLIWRQKRYINVKYF